MKQQLNGVHNYMGWVLHGWVLFYYFIFSQQTTTLQKQEILKTELHE